MKRYEELDKRNVHEVEKDILASWKGVNTILQKTIENRNGCENFVFFDGPIYANALPGLHHLYGKNIKDCFCKYQTMQGKKVLRKIGLDTHGLPIEVNVEKKLGFKSKLDIENFGVDKFNQECKKATDTNVADVINLTNMMGQFIDTDHPYITCSNEYIESEWWVIKQFAEANLLYHSNKVLPYCTRCGTELSAHEVAQEYQEIPVNTVYVPFKLKDMENTYALVWTTTPWTLLANVALCVNPKEKYVKVKAQDKYYILAEALAEKVLDEEFEIVETYQGKDLENIQYEQFLPFIKPDKKAFFITCDEYVTMSDGTGIVHIAPAFGVDDANVAKKYDLPTINLVGTDGKYKEGPWKDRVVYEEKLEIDIIKYLAGENKLYKKVKIKHNYPHCWRCKTPLLYYAKPAWYIKTTAYKDKIIKANKTVNWYPAFVGEKRFANWLENLVDWGISRNRYWGAPLPVWTCQCGHMHTIGSIKELKELALEEIDDDKLDLHRPFVDNIHIKCSKCGQSMNRVSDVLDVWFDSGVMPYAQYHYPFENKELFNEQFPADFIAEGIDQTRGWFYVLLVISTFISGKAPYKNVLVNDLLLDAEGKKMSKSKGNVIEPFSALKEYGADVIRFYLLYVSPVWTPLKFDIEGIKEVYSKFFNPLRNTYNFFSMYANTDDIDIKNCQIDVSKREDIDRWLISKYNHLVKDVTTYFEEYDLNKVTKVLCEFVSDDLSNWYIRRNRKRFWKNELDVSKKSVYLTTYEILVGLSKLIAPIIPFLSHEIYFKLTKKEVHLADYPKVSGKLIDDKLEAKMDLVREIISVGRQAREEAKIKVRQPLSKVIIDGKNEEILSDLVDLIKEELNVKEVEFTKELNKYMNFSIKPNFKVAGPVMGAKIKEFAQVLSTYTQEEIIDLSNGETHFFEVEGQRYEFTKEMTDVRTSAKDGFDVGMIGGNFVILNTTLSQDLIEEGIAREFISKIQNLRKAYDFEITDRIIIYYQAAHDIVKAIKNNEEYIKKEVLAVKLVSSDQDLKEQVTINTQEIKILIEKQ